jgi:hypothetical protein
MDVRRMLALVLVPTVIAVAACSSEPKEETPAAPAAAPAATPEAPPATTPKVMFLEPADGATVKSPVHMKFGVENYTISPVPTEVTEVRPNTGHYHLAIDTDCLAPGAEIVKGANWIHYGKGDTEADTQLSPGTHKLTLAVGDDKHMQVPGLCSTITVTAQ